MYRWAVSLHITLPVDCLLVGAHISCRNDHRSWLETELLQQLETELRQQAVERIGDKGTQGASAF